MKAKILPILLSNIIVATAVWLIAGSTSNDSDMAAKDKEIESLKAELSKRQRQPQKSQRSRVAASDDNSARADQENSSESQEQRRAERNARRAQFQQMRNNAVISRLGLRLNLSEDQKSQLNAQMEKRNAVGAQLGEVFESMRRARENGEDTTQLEAQLGALQEQMRETDPERYVAELLSDEQKIQYQEYQQERATNRAETAATMSLSMMQEAVSMTQEQKDRYFAAYAQAALANDGRVDPDAAKSIAKDVLTNEQYSVYEQQADAFRQAMGGRGGMRGGPGAGGRPPQ